jgi:diguanylate cyclase (GGDEF)-like protein
VQVQATRTFEAIPYLAQVAAIALAYVIAARMSLALAIPPGYATAVWPPSGIAVAAALLLGARIWPAIWIGAALANVMVESSFFSAVLISSGNTLEALAACALIRRYAGDPARFERGEDVVKFIAICALACTIAASVALLPLAAGHSLTWQGSLRNWWTWWQGDLSGMIVAVPLILAWSARDAEPWPAQKKLEAACFGVLLLAAAVLLTGGNATHFAPFSLTFVALPFVIWAAFRFGQREVSTAIAVVCAIAVWYTVERRDLFGSAPLNELLLMLLTFNSIVVVTGLVLVAVVGERSRAMSTLRKRHDQLESGTDYDRLTGLPNASLFRQQLGQLLGVAAGSGGKVAVVVLNIERFESINDSYGRQGGDELLKQIAGRLAADMTGTTIVARLDGNRFALASHGFENESDVARAANDRLLRWFGPPYQFKTSELRVSARAGLALFPEDGAHPDILCMHAEAALKRAAAIGERYVFYRQEMSERVAGKLSLENKLRRAIEREEFVLHYQPKVDVDSRRLTGLEALIRWNSPERGLVPPMQFIPLLEETGMILEVGSWALRRAVLDQRLWAAEGVRAPRIAVNVSSIQLRQRNFVAQVQEAIDARAGAPLIDFEITETYIMEDIEVNIDKLRQLRGLGIGIAIDDFGTGYSSLAYLAKLPAQVLKIDSSFIARMLVDDDAMALVQTILSIATSLRLTTVAEGVESEEQADMLGLLRCAEMQGYFISKPLPREEITPFITN